VIEPPKDFSFEQDDVFESSSSSEKRSELFKIESSIEEKVDYTPPPE
jgi:hypothetical protein